MASDGFSPSFEDMFEGMAALMNHFEAIRFDSETMSMIREGRYRAVKGRLNPENVNKCIRPEIDIYSMTGLEYSVYSFDWKMLLVFFFAGCDPEKREFDGYVQTHASSHGLEEPLTLPSVRAVYEREEQDGYEAPVVNGFPFLRLILRDEVENVEHPESNEHVQKTFACLWLLERLHGNRIALDDDTVNMVREYVHLINPSFDWETDFTHQRANIEGTLAQFELSKHLPENTLHAVAHFAQPVHDLLLRTIRSALTDAVEQACSVAESED